MTSMTRNAGCDRRDAGAALRPGSASRLSHLASRADRASEARCGRWLLAMVALLAALLTVSTEAAEQYHGIDISHHQGRIDWATVARGGRVQFVYVRASNGSRPDKNYHHNLVTARQHGLMVGSYHFLNPNCPVKTQFQFFASRVKRGEQDLIPVIDIEDVPELGVRWKPQQARDYLAEFAELVQRHYGVRPMIYTSNTFFTDYLGRAFASFPLFIARYGATEPAPQNGARWTLWQFTRQGRVEGINHAVDLSRFNQGFGLANIRMPGSGKAKKHHPKSTKAASGKAKKGHHGKGDRTAPHSTSKAGKRDAKARQSTKAQKANKASVQKSKASPPKRTADAKPKKPSKAQAKKPHNKPNDAARGAKRPKTKKK